VLLSTGRIVARTEAVDVEAIRREHDARGG
jgi:hypothetical protein